MKTSPLVLALLFVASLVAPGALRAESATPPDGVYNCMKISGSSLISLGTLEIKGGTYRGIGDEAPFAPYTVDGGGAITWSAGLAGMPDGWTLKESRYTGKNKAGQPLITIRYTSKSGNAEVIDAVRE